MIFSLISQINFFENPLYFISMLLLMIIPLFFSLSFHEASHAYIAYLFGDNTPKYQNRLTLNPFAHFDLGGFIMLMLVGIGWAKPVIINMKNWTQFMFVSIAGPISNIILAIIFAILKAVMILKFNYQGQFANPLYFLFDIFVYVNTLLAVFNLLPIPPLDGSRVVSWMLTDDLKEKYNAITPYCILIIFILFFVLKLDFLSYISGKIINFMYTILESIL